MSKRSYLRCLEPSSRRAVLNGRRVRRILEALELRGYLRRAMWIARTHDQALALVLGKSQQRPIVQCRQELLAELRSQMGNVSDVARLVELPRGTVRSAIRAYERWKRIDERNLGRCQA